MKKFTGVFTVVIIIAVLLVAFFLVRNSITVPEVTKPPVAAKTLKEIQNGVPLRIVGNNLQWPGRKIMALGFLDACEKAGALCVDSGNYTVDDAGFIDSVETAISQGSTGITSAFYSQYYAVVGKAIKAGIPVVSFHVPTKEGDIPGLLAWVATDVADYGKRSGEAMADKLKCAGPVIAVQSGFNETENLAASSFIDAFKAKCPDAEVLPTEEQGLEMVASIAKNAAILTAHPEIKGIYGTTGNAATSWSTALEQTGFKPGDVVVIGMDYMRDNLDKVKAGWVYMLVGQPLYEECYKAAEILIDHMLGKPVQFANPLPAPLITAADVDKYYSYADRTEGK